MLSGKSILIGVTAGVAAYKVYELMRMFLKENAKVRVVLTENALEFMSPLVIETLTGAPVHVGQYKKMTYSVEHINLADSDVFVVAPATANTIGKFANGICDNLLTSVFCAFKKPVIIAPSMNTGMWENAFVQQNVMKLQQAGYHMVEPEEGFLACGTSGKGRLATVETIYQKTLEVLGC